MRRIKRGAPVLCTMDRGLMHAVVYDHQLPRELERGLVYVRITVDGPLARRGQRLHVPVACLARRTPRAHRGRTRPVSWRLPWSRPGRHG